MGSTMQKKSWPVTVKTGDGSRSSLRFIISTGSMDRDNDIIDPRGWDLHEYLTRNPVVLWQHDRSRPPIAKTTAIRVVGQALHATAEFPPIGVYPLADEIHGLVAAGFLHSASVGFLPVEKSWNAARSGYDIKSAVLLEWSIVNLPSNSEAVIQRCLGLGCDNHAMSRWLKGASCRCASEKEIELEQIEVPPKSLAGCPLKSKCPTPADGHPDQCKKGEACPLRKANQSGGQKNDDVLAGIVFSRLIMDKADELEVEDEAEHVLQAAATVSRLIRDAVRGGLRELIPAAIQKEINYHRGRVD